MPVQPIQVERRVSVMGYRSVGKSSLTVQFTENRFPERYDPTISNTFTKPFDFHDKKFVLHLFDTAGQDKFSLLLNTRPIDVHGYVLVYAINSRKSFEVVQCIYDKIIDTVGSAQVPLTLVGNKIDLNAEERKVTTEEGKKLADKWKAGFVEASARDNKCVKEIFEHILCEIDKSLTGSQDVRQRRRDVCSIY